MQRHCGPEDRYIGDGDTRCGMFFDDVERSTVCPHPWLSHNVRDRTGFELMLWWVQWCAIAQEVLDDMETRGARQAIRDAVAGS